MAAMHREETDRELIIRAEARISGIESTIDRIDRESDLNLRELKEHLKTEVRELKTLIDTMYVKVEKNYVTKDQFGPINKVIWGGLAFILTTVGGALLNLVMRTPPQ